MTIFNDGIQQILATNVETSEGVVGSIQFSDGASGFNSDGANLFWDDATKRLAIGHANPAAMLHLEESIAGQVTLAWIKHGDNTNSGSHATLNLITLDATGGDPSIIFSISNVGDWGLGVDNSDGDKFKISTIADIRGTEVLTIDRNGVVALTNGIVIGHTSLVTVGSTAKLQALGTGGSDSAVIVGRWQDNAFAPKISFAKSRGATIGSSAIINDNDTVGLLRFCPDDGVGFTTLAAQFGADVDDASPAVGDIGMAFIWEQMDGVGGALAETMRLSAAGTLVIAGNVEIGSEGGGTRKLSIKGSDPTGTGEGGEIQLFLADDFDTTIASYSIDAFEDDLRFFGAGGTPNMTLTAEGYLVLTSSAKTDTGDPASREGMIYWNTIDNVIRMFADGAWRTLLE